MGCDRSDRSVPPQQGPIVSSSSVRQQVLDSITPVQLSVKNGETVLIKLKSGFALLVPHMTDIDNGSYEILSSETGDFSKEPQVLRQYKGRILDHEIDVDEHSFNLSGETSTSLRITLDLEDTTAAMANLGSIKLSELDLSKIPFQKSPTIDSSVMRKFLIEAGILK
jgi:hypothetical protein